MTTLTSTEQLILEMINRARMDPNSEVARIQQELPGLAPWETVNFTSLNQFTTAGEQGTPISSAPAQVLAGNNTLTRVAEVHSAAMNTSHILEQTQTATHNGHNAAGDGLPNRGAPDQRIADAGYAQNPLSFFRDENINVEANSAAMTQDQIAKMAKTAHDDLFYDDPAHNSGDPAGHRIAMLDPNMKEVGVGTAIGTFTSGGTTFNALFTTEEFGVTGTNSFLTGVVYNDANHNNFYDLNEGIQSITATVTNAAGTVIGNDVTGSGGGWSVSEPGGTYTVTFTGTGVAGGSVAATVDSGNLNAKVDLVNGNAIFSNVNTTLGANATELHLLGITGINATGNSLANTFYGTIGNNIFDGGAGNDTVVYTGNKASYTITQNTDGSTTVSGPEGTDKLISIESIKFADQTVPLSAPAQAGSVTINDVQITEGNSGTQVATFTVTRAGGTAAFDVNFNTADISATTADGDYVANSGTLHFGTNVNTQTVSVVINGDTKVEGNETFAVNLSSPTNGATISDGQGIGSITNDDAAAVAGSISINDVQITEGNSGTQLATFTVTRTGGTAAFDVNFATADGTATTADGDYAANSGTLHFGANVNTQTVSVVINGDTKVEANETFGVDLSSPTNGATITDGHGAGNIINDDAAAIAGSVSINDVQITEGNSGTQVATFTVTRTGGTAAFDLHYGTTDGTATTADGDYAANSGTLHFGANVNTQTVSVVINGDTKVEANETFGVDLSSPTNGATITDGHGVGMIINDDTVTGAPKAPDDYNGDGKSDILWRSDDGSVATWDMNDHQIKSSFGFGAISNQWHIADTGDFNGDGKADILWRADDGSVATWDMNDHQVTSFGFGVIGNNWHIAGTGDFNGDGKSDILWRADDGTVATWDMNDHQFSAFSFGAVGNNWHVAGTGDFNGDGKTDILWRADDGTVATWDMNDHQVSAFSFGAVGNNWQIAGTGDFNGDGKTDILWRGNDGTLASWDMNDHQVNAFSFGAVSTQWHVADTGDYNGDGKTDIAWRSDDGSLATWDMNDHQFSAFSFGQISTQWHIVA